MNLSVIIPSRTASNLISCVQAIRRHETAADTTIIVIDDGVDWVGSDFACTCRPLAMLCTPCQGKSRSSMYARNCNIGIRAAGTDDVALLNDDALLESAAGFNAMQRAAELHPEYGVIGAVTNVTGQPLQQPHGIGLREVRHIAFMCVLIPRRTIDRVGLLDERYCLDYGVEDLDYCEACRRAGLKVGVFDHCCVDHGSLTSSFRGDPSNSRSFARNKALFDAKWGSVLC
jgi:GT2 family glycosyltransferase